jgi:hypothetical protein
LWWGGFFFFTPRPAPPPPPAGAPPPGPPPPAGGGGGPAPPPPPHVRVRADAERLLAITNAPLRFGLPDPTSAEGRAVLLDLVARRVRVGGLLRHPVRLARSMSLLSVADGVAR